MTFKKKWNKTVKDVLDEREVCLFICADHMKNNVQILIWPSNKTEINCVCMRTSAEKTIFINDRKTPASVSGDILFFCLKPTTF